MIPLYRAGWQLTKVRGVMIFSLICAVISLRVGWHLAHTYGLNPADGGVLAPLGVRLAWGIGVALLGVGFAAGMWLYGKCYVAQVDLDEVDGRLHVYTVRFFGLQKHVLDPSDVRSRRDHLGYWLPRGIVTPWRSVWIRGRRLPLLIDGQGTFLNRDRMDRLL